MYYTLRQKWFFFEESIVVFSQLHTSNFQRTCWLPSYINQSIRSNVKKSLGKRGWEDDETLSLSLQNSFQRKSVLLEAFPLTRSLLLLLPVFPLLPFESLCLSFSLSVWLFPWDFFSYEKTFPGLYWRRRRRKNELFRKGRKERRERERKLSEKGWEKRKTLGISTLKNYFSLDFSY